MLRQANIPALDIKHASRDGQYIIQEALDSNVHVTFKQSDLVDGATMQPKRRLSRGQQQAIADLHKKLIDGGLIWEDGHVENMFFRRTGPGDSWEAGVLDSDRIAFVGAGDVRDSALPRRLGDMVGRLQALPGAVKGLLSDARIRSLAGLRGIDIPDNRFFMEKMLEYRDRFIWFDPEAKQFKPLVLDLDIVERLHPDFRRHVDLVPKRGDVAGLSPPAAPPPRPRRRRPGPRRGIAVRRRSISGRRTVGLAAAIGRRKP